MATPAQQIVEAVRAGNADAVVALLNADSQLANVSGRAFNGFSLLHHASMHGDLVLVELLLAAGANVNKRSSNGAAPLHQATAAGAVEIVRTLIAAGAETRATMNDGSSALDIARHIGNQELIDLLSQYPVATVRNSIRGKRDWS